MDKITLLSAPRDSLACIHGQMLDSIEEAQREVNEFTARLSKNALGTLSYGRRLFCRAADIAACESMLYLLVDGDHSTNDTTIYKWDDTPDGVNKFLVFASKQFFERAMRGVAHPPIGGDPCHTLAEQQQARAFWDKYEWANNYIKSLKREAFIAEFTSRCHTPANAAFYVLYRNNSNYKAMRKAPKSKYYQFTIDRADGTSMVVASKFESIEAAAKAAISRAANDAWCAQEPEYAGVHYA